MKEKLKSELKNIAHSVLKMNSLDDITTLQAKARVFYEKLTVLKFMETNPAKIPATDGKNEVAEKFEELASNVITENTQVPETNPHEEDLVTPLMNTIKDLVAEMPKEETLDDILSDVHPNPTFIKKDRDTGHSSTVTSEKISESKKLSLNDILKKGIQIGLNDRIGFVKHLFDGSDEDFNRVLSQLNSMGAQSEAKSFIINEVKPDYNNWKGKEDYEFRFLELIEAKFDI